MDLVPFVIDRTDLFLNLFFAFLYLSHAFRCPWSQGGSDSLELELTGSSELPNSLPGTKSGSLPEQNTGNH